MLIPPLHVDDMYPSIVKPFEITFVMSNDDVARQIIENNLRLCIFTVDHAGPMKEDGTRDVTIKLVPLPELP